MLLTPADPLARTLQRRYSAWQRDRGRAVWPAPHIVSLDAWLAEQWTAHTVAAESGAPALLSPAQEAFLWEQVIRDAGTEILDPCGASAAAADAWRLLHAYRIPLDARYENSPDAAAFRKWAQAYQARCEDAGWTDAARLPDLLRAAPRAHVLHTAFEPLPPQTRDLFNAYGATAVTPALPTRVVHRTYQCASAEDELRAAARWSRERIERNPAAHIGVIVFGLPALRAAAARIFREELQPGADAAAGQPFHISLGPPLREYPLIAAALVGLEFACAPVPLARAGGLLRSPYLRGPRADAGRRAMLDAALRHDGVRELSVASLQSHSRSGGEWKKLQKLLSATPHRQRCADWCYTCSRILPLLGWPGTRPLDSHEHQLVQRWRKVLAHFASLDALCAPLTFNEALARVRLLCDAPFQFDDTGAPVYVTGPEQARGMRFDALWVAGLHDEALPAPPRVNPFLPVSLQRERDVPATSATLARSEARALFDLLAQAAPEVVMSYPAFAEDRALGPSPLLPAAAPLTASAAAPWTQRLVESAPPLEYATDNFAPALPYGAKVYGGATAVRDMSACPFRAQAAYRLFARKLQDPSAGISFLERGNAAHVALNIIWERLQSHARLLDCSDPELTDIISDAAASALKALPRLRSVAVEQMWLERALSRWLAIEKRRDPFEVLALEQTQENVSIDGLLFDLRIDRIDKLPDGRLLVFDYKTGEVAKGGWEGDRPDQPQLPLYCITGSDAIAGIAFARLRTGDRGYSATLQLGLGLPDMTEYGTGNWQRQLSDWHAALSELARRFREGDASIDPKHAHKTCQTCDLKPLCRIHERFPHA